jgi:hypothetical protein
VFEGQPMMAETRVAWARNELDLLRVGDGIDIH